MKLDFEDISHILYHKYVTKIIRIKQKGSFIRISLKEFDDGLPIYIFHKSLDIYTDAGVVYFTSYHRLYRSTRVELATEAEVVIKDCAYTKEWIP